MGWQYPWGHEFDIDEFLIQLKLPERFDISAQADRPDEYKRSSANCLRISAANSFNFIA
ncbi:hypothetical protein D1AOALGA4SA_6214 [Olavius algarvensis Delta 1 endosymbiont]|nr:hypothetical protein D1AOALGA4SA_6214 [Olavius algarvensis Delta 1 endosymbiont]